MTTTHFLDTAALEAGLEHIQGSPRDSGTVEMIIRRPGVDLREELEEADLEPDIGVVGDDWEQRGEPIGEYLDTQITLMNARVIDLVAGERSRWPLAGDQLYVDLDLSKENLPAGTRLELGSAVLEVTEIPHRGCAKFAGRFGAEALRFVNTGVGRDLSMRGIYARVVVPGTVRRGDEIIKV